MFLGILQFVTWVALVQSQSTTDDVCAVDGSAQCMLQAMQRTIEHQAEINRAQEMRIATLERVSIDIRDCDTPTRRGETSSGVYDIYARSLTSMQTTRAYCDMETDGGGWTVFQRRVDGSENFRRSWSEYKDGFGDASGEHWLGNEFLHLLTTYKEYMIRIDLEDWEGERRFAVYSLFRVHSEADKYRLELGDYSGNDGDGGLGFSYHNGAKFSTYDQDNDGWSTSPSCIEQHNFGGFWLDRCLTVGLNNYYSDSSDGNGGSENDVIRWDAWHGNGYSLKSAQMMIRPL